MTSIQPVPTLNDVAKAAGVSPATVSRALNSPALVSQTTLTRVKAAVDELGYTPNFGARFMAAKRTMTIGAIIPTMENAIFARGIQAFQEQLHSLGYTLLVSSSSYDPDIEEEQIRTLASRGADGILLIGYRRDERTYDFLRRRNIPFLLAWAFAANNSLPAVGFDNRASMYRLCNEVLGLGHRKFGIISGIVDGNDRAANRLKGIVERLKIEGIDLDNVPIIETSYEIENGARAFEQLMEGDDKPTVVMCGNDVLAVGAIQCATEMGLSVPEDVSVTGFDGIEIANIVTPKLATVHVPHAEMGRRAADELVSMVEQSTKGTSFELHSHVRLEASLGHPRNN
ncbi:LacI family DNA-binding transcriptional regulator [Thalassobium sp. R2A62]|uniref:LacI family DNA-binding transcriptional regulator n=1 Tax=Thalassobium sp. R2A62 TaxID=633131 RepID=UPI0001B1D0F0|nr:LacI family DNA-binding transcriptional regulator [Thalassobium sp. R2A62]EET48070.1 transcriptional regulator, LacI family [Thalassobium sp. R2A62]